MMQHLSFTSKASLKQQCLIMANGNIKEAKELYDFLIEDMPALPDTDPIPVTWQENTKETVNGLFSWVRENKDTLMEGIDFIRGMFNKNPLANSAHAEPLPSIN